MKHTSPYDRLMSLAQKAKRLDSATTSGSSVVPSSLLQGMEQLLATAEEKAALKEAKQTEKNLVIKPSQQMDVLFLLDATVSMSPNRDALVRQLHEVVGILDGAMLKYAQVRVAVVAYRDVKLTPRFEVLPFVQLGRKNPGGAETVCKWLSALKFTTNVSQDFPEDVHGGLEKAASDELQWHSPSRVVIHVADAPGHGRRMKDEGVAAGFKRFNADDQPDYDSDGKLLSKIVLKLREEVKVNTYYLLHVPTIDKGVKGFMTHAMAQRIKEAACDPAWVQDAEWCEEELAFQVVEAATSSVRDSISLAKERLGLASKEQNRASSSSSSSSKSVSAYGIPAPGPARQFRMDAAEPDWTSISPVRIKVTKHAKIQSLKSLLDMVKNKRHLATEEAEVGTLQIAPEPFSAGQSRLVYYGRYYPEGAHPSECQEVVLKEFTSLRGGANKAVNYKAQMETHNVASFLAELFNRHAREEGLAVPEVKFVDCTMIWVKQRGRERFMLMEELCLGEHAKFNNNCGAVNLLDPQPHLQAFSHWSYEVTDKQLMVVDLQGFKTMEGDEFKIILNDPALHSVSREHFNPMEGNNNLQNGFDLFLHSHCSEKINKGLREKYGFELHGPVCEALIPKCAAFRQRCDQQAAQGPTRPPSPFVRLGNRGQGAAAAGAAAGGNNAVRGRSATPGRVRPQRGQSPAPLRPGTAAGAVGITSHPLASIPSTINTAVTTASVARRIEAVVIGVKVHRKCQALLARQGLAPPRNLAEAISKCFQHGLIDKEKRDKWHVIRENRNTATHEWIKTQLAQI